MRHSIRIAVAAILLALPVWAQAQEPTAVERLLLEASTGEELRSRLIAFADTAAAGEASLEAGEALLHAGWSYERAGLLDSAITTYREAIRRRGAAAERLALIDALLRRRGEGDLAAALEEISTGRAATTAELQSPVPRFRDREAWAMVLANRPDSARVLFASRKSELSKSPEWRYRMARAEIAGGDPREAFALLRPLAVASRTTDTDVMGLISGIASATNVGGRLETVVQEDLTAQDRNEQLFVDGYQGRRVRFEGADGFDLGGCAFVPPGRARTRPAAIVLRPDGEPLADGDSLIAAFRRAGLSVMVLDVRGSGWSVDAGCPLPDTWIGREQRLQTLAARDVRVALRELARLTPIDTTRYLIAAKGKAAPIAAEAAALDRRVAALVLVSPAVPAVERGLTRARLARVRLPLYVQFAYGERPYEPMIDALLRASAERASRTVEGSIVGSGPLSYQLDASMPARLTRWVREMLPAPATTGSRRSTPRGG